MNEKCTTRNFFRPYPVVYDMDDRDLYSEFRRCMFSRKNKEGTYKFISKKSKDEMTYEIGKGRIYERSYGVRNGRKIRIEV